MKNLKSINSFLNNKKRKKDLAPLPGIYINKDAGDVETNVAAFNSATTTGSPMGAMGEGYMKDLYMDVEDAGGKDEYLRRQRLKLKHRQDKLTLTRKEKEIKQLQKEIDDIKRDIAIVDPNSAANNQGRIKWIRQRIEDLQHQMAVDTDGWKGWEKYAWKEIDRLKDELRSFGIKEKLMKENLGNVVEVEEKSREVVSPAFADGVREIKENDKKVKELQRVRKAPKEGEESLPKDLKLNLEESLFESVDTEESAQLQLFTEDKKPLKEQVSDEAYEVAKRINDYFGDSEFITRDEFDEQFAIAIREVFNLPNDEEHDVWMLDVLPNGNDPQDFEFDVRGILGFNGWATVYEGDDEGGLENTDAEKPKANEIIYNSLIEYEENHNDSESRNWQKVINKLIDYYDMHMTDEHDIEKYNESLKESKKLLKEEDGGWQIKYGEEWELLGELVEAWGSEYVLDQLAGSLGLEKLGEHLEYICRMHDFESEHFVNKSTLEESETKKTYKKREPKLTYNDFCDTVEGKLKIDDKKIKYNIDANNDLKFNLRVDKVVERVERPDGRPFRTTRPIKDERLLKPLTDYLDSVGIEYKSKQNFNKEWEIVIAFPTEG